MSQLTLAFDDLCQTLDSIEWLSVYKEKNKGGGRTWSLEVYRGASSFIPKIGCRRIINGYNLTLKTNGTTAPEQLAERLAIIDDVITADRRRGSNAQTTVMADEGWIPDEDEGREAFSISTTLEIHFNEVN